MKGVLLTTIIILSAREISLIKASVTSQQTSQNIIQALPQKLPSEGSSWKDIRTSNDFTTDSENNYSNENTPKPCKIIEIHDLPWEEQVNTATRFLNHRLVPELIALPPRSRCHAWFPGLLSPVRVIIGGELLRSDMFDPPLNMSWRYIPDKLYTVFLSTPDFTTSKNFTDWRQLHQWLVINVKNCDITSGDVVLDYLLPQVVRQAGFTRYAFLVYEQRERIPVSKIRRNGLDVNFTIKQYVQKHNLGNPKFGNYFFVYFE